MRQYRHAVSQSRPRTREIRVCVSSVDATIAQRKQIAPAFWKRDRLTLDGSALRIVSTRHDYDQLRPRLRDLRLAHLDRRFARKPQHVLTPGMRDHLRHPMPAHEIRVQPFQA